MAFFFILFSNCQSSVSQTKNLMGLSTAPNRAQVLPNGWMLLAIAYSCHAQDGSKQIMQICSDSVPADNGWSHDRGIEKVYIHRDDPVRYHLKYGFHPAVFL